MMDRSDIIIEVPEVIGQLLFLTKPAEASSTIAARIAKAAGFAESHDGLMGDIGENDPSDMARTIANLGQLKQVGAKKWLMHLPIA